MSTAAISAGCAGSCASRGETSGGEDQGRLPGGGDAKAQTRRKGGWGGRQVRTEGGDMPGKGAMVGTRKQVQRPPAGRARPMVQLTQKRACESRGAAGPVHTGPEHRLSASGWPRLY